MRRRSGSRPTPIVVPPLTPTTEHELRKSCSLLLLQPPPKTQRERTHTIPAPSSISACHTPRDLPPPPFARSPLLPRSSSHTPPPPNAPHHNHINHYGFAKTATARKLSVITATTTANGDGTVFGGPSLRASQIEIRRYDPGTPTGSLATINGGGSGGGEGDRSSAFLLAKPTLVDVLPPSPRPRTAGSTPIAASAGWGAMPPCPPMTPLTPIMLRQKHGKSDSTATTESGSSAGGGGGNRRLSLFPRPRTAHCGEGSMTMECDKDLRALPPLPLPASRLGRSGVEADEEDDEEEQQVAAAAGGEGGPEKSERRKKEKKTGAGGGGGVKGFVHLSAFLKATFRFGKRGRSS